MRTPQITIETKKVGAGHYQVVVTDEANDKVETFIETDMTIIDALSDEDGNDLYTQFEAMEYLISKAF